MPDINSTPFMVKNKSKSAPPSSRQDGATVDVTLTSRQDFQGPNPFDGCPDSMEAQETILLHSSPILKWLDAFRNRTIHPSEIDSPVSFEDVLNRLDVFRPLVDAELSSFLTNPSSAFQKAVPPFIALAASLIHQIGDIVAAENNTTITTAAADYCTGIPSSIEAILDVRSVSTAFTSSAFYSSLLKEEEVDNA